ncbi:MAG: hypothetical protein PWP31_474 [Clostridia bacterium]|nr:hypothetical protein [Clostridia bacterium]
MMSYRYLLFDLDGTLLPMDMDNFMNKYMEALARRLQHFIPPKKFIKYLLAATQAMIEDNNLERTNEEVFMEYFFSKTGLEEKDILPVFDEFYDKDFPNLKRYTKPTSLAQEIVKKASNLGYELVIATNPVFPRCAIKERMRWAGLDNINFRLITTYEDMHFCKPSTDYYNEILNILDVSPEACLMIGNDVDEDLVASKVGINTYLVEDFLLNRNNSEIKSNHRGSLKDFLSFLNEI